MDDLRNLKFSYHHHLLPQGTKKENLIHEKMMHSILDMLSFPMSVWTLHGEVLYRQLDDGFVILRQHLGLSYGLRISHPRRE